MRRNPPRCRAARDKKAARIARLEQELKLTEERKQLFAAAASGDVDRVQELIDSGMDVNYPDENQMTALHHAAMHARDKVIKALIERGANVNATDLKGGFSSLHWVVINADPQMGSTDHVDESIVALAKGGADVNCTDFNFATPLHIAAQKGNKVVVDSLIRLGADPDLTDITGRNSTAIAKEEEIKELIQKLQRMKKNVIYHVLEIPQYHVLEIPSVSPDRDSAPPTPPRRRKAPKS